MRCEQNNWGCVYLQDIDHFQWVLTDEAKGYLEKGSPEAQVFNAVPADGIAMAALKVRCYLFPPNREICKLSLLSFFLHVSARIKRNLHMNAMYGVSGWFQACSVSYPVNISACESNPGKVSACMRCLYSKHCSHCANWDSTFIRDVYA